MIPCLDCCLVPCAFAVGSRPSLLILSPLFCAENFRVCLSVRLMTLIGYLVSEAGPNNLENVDYPNRKLPISFFLTYPTYRNTVHTSLACERTLAHFGTYRYVSDKPGCSRHICNFTIPTLLALDRTTTLIQRYPAVR
ncbi:hypothetical protein F4824DRAFT_262436 [Ustulina deusta]|nr:hypothetical protein F4823DRAFT_439651 [Ustulina deusta]KAI3341767.1 hypothetical protein F4824DRAFT_262436 [Ustulina deusta]